MSIKSYRAKSCKAIIIFTKALPKSNSIKRKQKYSSVFRENRCPPLPKPVYGGNFLHEAVTLKIKSRSPKSNKLLILSDLYRLDRADFSDQFRKIIVRYKRIGYNINIMRQSACLVFNPITVNNFASLFNCTPVGRASDSMMAPT